MHATEYRNIPVKYCAEDSWDLTGYQNVMNLISYCLAKGGKVEYEHRQMITGEKKFSMVSHKMENLFKDVINVKLFWD